MKTVCIVDDQLIALDAMKLILEEADDIELIGIFSSIEEFISEYDILLPDVTVIDLDFPTISGSEAIRAIRLKYPRARFLVLTNFDDDKKLMDALKAGATGYLLKKCSLDNLVASIETVFKGGSPLSPGLIEKIIIYLQHFERTGWKFKNLTQKELMILQFLAEGLLYKEIADKLSLSIDSIKKYAQHIYEKLEVHTRSEAIKKYYTT